MFNSQRSLAVTLAADVAAIVVLLAWFVQTVQAQPAPIPAASWDPNALCNQNADCCGFCHLLFDGTTCWAFKKNGGTVSIKTCIWNTAQSAGCQQTGGMGDCGMTTRYRCDTQSPCMPCACSGTGDGTENHAGCSTCT